MNQQGVILNSQEILEANIVENAETRLVTQINGMPVISYGLSSYGYDLRLDNTVIVYQQPAGGLPNAVDPKRGLDPTLMQTHCLEPHKPFYLPAHSFALANSVELLTIPDNVTGIALGKSTYARCGLILNCTPAEAGWKGYLTLEITNTLDFPVAVYSYEGIVQLLFLRGNPTTTTYQDRRGKYQDQPRYPIGPKV